MVSTRSRYVYMDGSVSSADRQLRVDRFNTDPTLFCFLLTTKVGGVGLNLTGADRVIVADPSWNPVHENQVRGGI